MREMEADVLQRSGCFPTAALLPVNKQKYWSAKYNISLSAPERSGDAPDLREQRGGCCIPARCTVTCREAHLKEKEAWITPGPDLPSSLINPSSLLSLSLSAIGLFVLFFFF